MAMRRQMAVRLVFSSKVAPSETGCALGKYTTNVKHVGTYGSVTGVSMA